MLVAAEEWWIWGLEFRNLTRTERKFHYFTWPALTNLPPKIIKHAKVRVRIIIAIVFDARIVNDPTKRFRTMFRSLSLLISAQWIKTNIDKKLEKFRTSKTWKSSLKFQILQHRNVRISHCSQDTSPRIPSVRKVHLVLVVPSILRLL